jgi:16S rRNA (guanine1516-N2)-methyltransferase
MNQQNKHIEIEVRTTDEIRVAEAKKISQLHINPIKNTAGLVLSFLDSHTELRRPNTKVGNGFTINFSSVDRRRGAGNLSKKQPLPKAIGSKNQSIVDATAGFCGDSILLALMGFRVIAIERSPIISLLLRDAMRRSKEDTELWSVLEDNLSIVEGDAIHLLKTFRETDVIYIDPMFPQKKKSSPLPPGRIQLLSQIVGNDLDANHLFDAALNTNANRVVVKRPRYALAMSGQPIIVHKGKQVRYEVYNTTGCS